MGILQAVVIGLIALIVTPGYLFYFDVTPKVIVLTAGTALVLLCATALRPVHKLFSLLLLLNTVSLGVSTAWSTEPALSVFGTNWRRFGAVPQVSILLFAWLVAQHAAGRPDRVRTILRGVAVTGILTALYGIAQYFGWDPILPGAAYHIGEGIWTIVRPPGTMGYVSYFATWLLAVSFLGAALYHRESGAAWRCVAIAAAILAAIAMLLTGTRAAVVGLVVGLIVALYHTGFRIPRKAIAAAAILLLAGSAFYFSPAGWKLRSRTRWFAEDPWGGARPNLWRDSLRMGTGRPLVGYGPEVFTAAFPQFESQALARAYPDFSYESPHNMFLDVLVAQGLPGLAILCALCLVGLRRPRDAAARWIVAGVAAGIVAQQFTVFIVPTALITYTLVALAVAAQSAADSRVSIRKAPLALRAAVAPVALALVYVAARFAVSDRALALTSRALESGDLSSATAHYALYERWRLPGTSADLWYSRASLNLALKALDPAARVQAMAQSGAAGVRATRNAEDPFDAWYNMAELYATQNDAHRTEACLRAAIAARPNWFKPHWALAQLLRLRSRTREAEDEAAIAADLNGGRNAEVSRTLAEIRAQRAQALPSEHR